MEYLDNLGAQRFLTWIDGLTEVINTFSDIFVRLIDFKDRANVEYVIEITKMEKWLDSYLIQEVGNT